MEGVRMFSAMASGIYRSGVNFIPMYSKDYVALLLENYADKIGIYKHEYDAIKGGIDDKEEFIEFVRSMLGIHLSMDVWEAGRSFRGAYMSLERANITYHTMYHRFDESRAALEESTDEFGQCIGQELAGMFREAMQNLLKGTIKMVFGRRRWLNAYKIVQDLQQFIQGLQRLAESMEKLADCMESIERVMTWLNYILYRWEECF